MQAIGCSLLSIAPDQCDDELALDALGELVNVLMGYVVRDTGFPGGYKRWDGIDRRWINVTPTTTNNDGILPEKPVVPMAKSATSAAASGSSKCIK